MAPVTHLLCSTDTFINNFLLLWFFRFFSPIYHEKKKLKTDPTYLIKFFLFISSSSWAQTSLSNLQELKEKAPFRGWGVGKRVRSGLSAALSQRDIRNARELWHIQRKPPLGGGGWACECAVVHPLRSRKGTSGTQGGGG